MCKKKGKGRDRQERTKEKCGSGPAIRSKAKSTLKRPGKLFPGPFGFSETASSAACQQKNNKQAAVITSASEAIAGTSAAAAAAGKDNQKPDNGTASVSSE